jgi:hypothetical protein
MSSDSWVGSDCEAGKSGALVGMRAGGDPGVGRLPG